MAKKKIKKKKARRKKRRRKIICETIRDKIARIRDRVPYIEPTGECKDETTKEILFRFTEAQEVFRIYRQECETEGLIWRPYCAVGIQPVVVAFQRGIYTLIPFCIEDIKTGEIIVGWGSGGGNNADWSGNTAHTRALKQFLLTTFGATWQDPEHITDAAQKELIKQQVFKELQADGTLSTIEQIKHWTKIFSTKGVDNGHTKRANPKHSTGNSDKANRAGAKRHPGRGKKAAGKKPR